MEDGNIHEVSAAIGSLRAQLDAVSSNTRVLFKKVDQLRDQLGKTQQCLHKIDARLDKWEASQDAQLKRETLQLSNEQFNQKRKDRRLQIIAGVLAAVISALISAGSAIWIFANTK